MTTLAARTWDTEPVATDARRFTVELVAPAVGERLPGTQYVVMRRIGQGGMGEIYEAEHAELGRRVALKVLHRQHLGRTDLSARLFEEARILARLRHPNLVEVFDLGVTADGRPWFAMSLLRGRDLREVVMRRGPLPAPAAAALVAQALDGLSAAHAAGLVHRDVKLENLFLEEDGTVKVLDFGIAKITDAAGLTDHDGVCPGTPRTMAPEQCGGGPVDARADVYAMGLALYELCAGRGPFDDLRGHDHALRFAHCRREPLAPSALAPRPLPPWLDGVVLRAIAKDPEDRFQSAQEMAAALRMHTGREATPPPPSSRARRARRRARGRARPFLTAARSALAIACFALGLVFGHALPIPAMAAPVGVAVGH